MSSTPHDIAGYPPPPQGFAHAASATGDRFVCLSGQVGSDESGQLVAGGLGAQVEQALVNVERGLDAAGASLEDLVRLRFYVVGWEPSMLEEFLAGGAAGFARLENMPRVAVTLIGVASLFTPDMLVEVEAEAVTAAA